jgi:hypothetical protein
MSDNKGLENTKYKLIKNEDKLVLTDKKTLKARVLDIEDIDYVVDDNQRLRDPNVIENYFRLKDEPYEPKMMTKTADYVKEQKEAEKLYSPMKYEDLIDEFIKKYSLSNMEIEKFSQIPDETTIKKLYGRKDDEKKAMINDFKILKKKLTENKNLGADIFSYLKSYFTNYTYNVELMDLYDKVSFESYIKDKSFYRNIEEYNKIKDKNIKSLQDLYDADIPYFGGINLKYLDILIKKYDDISDILVHNTDCFQYDSNHLAKALSDKYLNNLNLMVLGKDTGKGGGEEEDERDSELAIELYKKLNEEDKKIFDGWMKSDDFRKQSDIYINTNDNKNLYQVLTKLPNENTFDKFKKKYEDLNKPKEPAKPLDLNKPKEPAKPLDLNKPKEPAKPLDLKKPKDEPKEIKGDKIYGYFSIHNDIIAALYKQHDSLRKMSPIDKNDKYDTIDESISNITTYGLQYFDANFKIQIVIDLINSSKDKNMPYKIMGTFWGIKTKKDKFTFSTPTMEFISGDKKHYTQEILGCNKEPLKAFYQNVLDKILPIILKDINIAKGVLNNKGFGWTDDTLTRIEKINNTLSTFGSGKTNHLVWMASGWTNNVSSGWTDDTLTRIEKITDILKGYGSGRVNPALLRVMNRASSGWTDDTLTRIEKITDVLKDYN